MEHVSELLPAIAEAKGIRESDLKLVEAVTIIRQRGTPAPSDLFYMAVQLVLCTLPQSDPGDVPRVVRTDGDRTLTLISSVGYPYGSIARLLLFWVTGEAVKTQSRRIGLKDSFHAFLKELGFSPRKGGRGPRSDYKRVREQIRRLFSTVISFSTGGPDMHVECRANMRVASCSELWWDPKKSGKSYVELSEEFFNAITARPVPLDSDVLKQLKRSPLALDLYAWTCHKVYTINARGSHVFVPWRALHKQFGADYNDVKNFKRKAITALRKIAVFYPDLDLEFVPGGVKIFPSSRLAVPYRQKSTIAVQQGQV